jgi:hypothetical protein
MGRPDPHTWGETLMAAPGKIPEVHRVNPFLGGPVCRSTDDPICMTEDPGLVRCAGCESAWEKYFARKVRRVLSPGRMTE